MALESLPAPVAAAGVVPAAPRARKSRGSLPGFGLSLGVTVSYLTLLVLIPLAGLAWKTPSLSGRELLDAVLSPRALAAYRLSFGAAAAAATVNAVVGLMLAWVLARYRFFGHGLIDARVDLPFALPTAVGGLALTELVCPDSSVGRV